MTENNQQLEAKNAKLEDKIKTLKATTSTIIMPVKEWPTGEAKLTPLTKEEASKLFELETFRPYDEDELAEIKKETEEIGDIFNPNTLDDVPGEFYPYFEYAHSIQIQKYGPYYHITFIIDGRLHQELVELKKIRIESVQYAICE